MNLQPPMNADLREALEALHDFRQFHLDNVTQTRLGAAHPNPIWTRIAAVLEKHGMNDRGMWGGPATERYFHWDESYYCRR